jgi:hypothetical protein
VKIAAAHESRRVQFLCYRDALLRTGLSDEHFQTVRALARQSVQKRNAVGGQHALDETHSPLETRGHEVLPLDRADRQWFGNLNDV